MTTTPIHSEVSGSQYRTQPQHTAFDFCVLIPCFNNLPGLIESLNSIHYPYQKCLVVIVDDGSPTPVTVQQLTPALKTALNLHIIQNKKNRGITYSLNTGLQWIIQNVKTNYIARLDCSDICEPERFYKQVDYLNTHADIGLIGSWCYFKDADMCYTYTTPTEYKDIKKAMYSRNVFIHPTVMFRAGLVEKVGYYPDTYPHAEDYAFFWRIINSTKAAILNQFLVTCAINRRGISFLNRRKQLTARSRVVADFGTNFELKLLGYIKLKLLMLIPQELLLKVKSKR